MRWFTSASVRVRIKACTNAGAKRCLCVHMCIRAACAGGATGHRLKNPTQSPACRRNCRRVRRPKQQLPAAAMPSAHRRLKQFWDPRQHRRPRTDSCDCDAACVSEAEMRYWLKTGAAIVGMAAVVGATVAGGQSVLASWSRGPAAALALRLQLQHHVLLTLACNHGRKRLCDALQ